MTPYPDGEAYLRNLAMQYRSYTSVRSKDIGGGNDPSLGNE